MAQKTEKEEKEFKVVPEALTLCINNCGVTGNPATNNMCQKCFNITTASSSSSTAAIGVKFSEKSRRSVSIRSLGRISDAAEARLDLRILDRADRAATAEVKDDMIPAPKREVNRCSCCRRKVGLTGIRCRCGEMFCSEHRYSDRHDCSYDYKAAGREAIIRENPVVKAAKIVRI